MKKQMKRIIAIVCTLALAITSLAFMPTTSKADDTWIKCTKTTTSPETSPSTADYTHWRFKKNDSNGAMEYCWINQSADPNDLSKVKFRKTYDATGSDGKPLDLSWAWNTAEIWKYGEDADHPLENNAVYSGSITIHSSMATETDCVLGVNVFGTSIETPLVAGDNTINFTDATYINDDVTHPEFKKIVFNIIQLSKYCEITVTDIQMQKSADPYYKATQNVDFVPENDGVKSPWTLRANYDGSNQYGNLLYKFDKTKDASTIPALSIKTAGSVGEQELDPQGHPVTPENRWWWVSASLVNYATTAGLEKFSSYTGKIVFNTDKPTVNPCKLFVYIDGNEYAFSLQNGANTLNIPEFTFKSVSKDVKFLFDELPKDSIVSVSSISFTETSSGNWTRVPNSQPTFTQGPWNMFANFIDEPESGNWGVMHYKALKENPQTYSDYSMRATCVSGWLAWSVFARMENFFADYYDFGDPYDITITLTTNKPTVPTAKEDDLDQLLVLVGSDMHYYDLYVTEQNHGVNVLHIQGDSYKVDQFEPHEQLMFEMDGLQEGTEITINDIQINNGPNEGWTNVPNKSWTEVGDWSLYSAWDETHWSKLAYRDSGTDSGLGAYDFKLRRTSKDWTKEASMATLSNYLSTAKDAEGYDMSDGDTYNTKLTINARGLADSVSNYGKLVFNANGEQFQVPIQKGLNTYDLEEITGKTFIYNKNNTKDVDFEFDEMTDKAIVTIQDMKFYNKSGSGTEVPNDEAFKPDGTPWTLYALTDSSVGAYGALKYTVEGDPAELPSLKLNIKGASGWLDAEACMASLVNRLNGLVDGHEYSFKIKTNIDETNAEPTTQYDKKLRIKINGKNYDFDVNAQDGKQTFEGTFTYETSRKDDHVCFIFDQMLKGTIFSVDSVEITDSTPTTQAPTTTTKPTTTAPTTTAPTTSAPTTAPTTSAPTTAPTTTPVPTEPTSEVTTEPTSEVTTSPETSTVEPSTEVTTAQPSSETASSVETSTRGSDVTTTAKAKVKAPGKAKIKKVYKKKKSAKKLKLKLKKIKRAKGYQVAVFKSKKKAKKAKKPLVKRYTKKLKVTIKSKKLKNKKKLYVRARAYVLNGKKKVFGKWSKIRKVKIKK